MNGLILNELIVLANKKTRDARERLETEEGGRRIAKLQGNIQGFKNLVTIISAEFHLEQSSLSDEGDMPIDLHQADDMVIDSLSAELTPFRSSAEWGAVLARLETDAEEMKNYLLLQADKAHELDICQGKYRGETFYTYFFNEIEVEAKNRQAKRDEAAKNPALIPEVF